MAAATAAPAQEGAAPAAAAPGVVTAPPGDPSLATKTMLPEVISTYGDKVDRLFYLISGITFVAFIIVEVLFVVFLVRYRHREGRRASYTHGNKTLEIVWTVATAAILVFIAIVQKQTWAEIKQYLPGENEKPFLVRVFGEQFAWHFVYPGSDGRFEPEKVSNMFPGDPPEGNPIGLEKPEADVYRKTLFVPVNTKVVLELNSLPKYDQNKPEGQRETTAVLHSFFSTNLRLKQDVVPYHPAKIWFEATKPGHFEIACAELCGLGHYQMRADFKVLNEEELKAALGYDWKAGTQPSFEGLGKR
jgi:cytochrome c oxidase subunit 2